MSIENFDDLADSTRLWIYAADRPLSHDETSRLTAHIDRFLQQWTAHKKEMRTGWRLQYNQFVMVAVDQSMMAASGCSIDSMVRSLQEFEAQSNCQIVGTNAKIFYRDQDGNVQCVDRPEFRRLAEDGEVNENTVVFNNVIATLADFRNGKWEIAMKDSWHWEVFGAAFTSSSN